jgi:hypothetical protein
VAQLLNSKDMTPQEIEDTKTIAEFEGFVKCGKANRYKFEDGIEIPIIHFKYLSSWDALHRVWEKYRKLEVPNFDIDSVSKRVQRNTLKEQIYYVGDIILNGTIQEAFTAIANAIRWYKSIK